MKEIRKVCIYGVGGIGGFFAGKIAPGAEKNKDYEVYFIARGAHLNEIQKKGLIFNTPEQSGVICKPVLATEKFSELPVMDLILLCVKSYGLEQAVHDISTNISSDTIVLPLLNGVDIYDRVRGPLQTGIVLPACIYISTTVEKPGEVSHKGGPGLVIFGKDLANSDFYPEKLLDFFKHFEINHKWVDNSFPAIWEKYIFIAPFSLVTAYADKTIGEVMDDNVLTAEVRSIMDEIVLLAKKEGIELRETIVDESLAKAKNFTHNTKTSYQRDVEQKSPRNEGDLFGDTIIRMGEKHSIPTPMTKRIYTALEKGLP